jgi:hypothetical protein
MYSRKLHRSKKAMLLLFVGREALLSLRLLPELSLPPMESRCREFVPAAVFSLGQATLKLL